MLSYIQKLLLYALQNKWNNILIYYIQVWKVICKPSTKWDQMSEEHLIIIAYHTGYTFHDVIFLFWIFGIWYETHELIDILKDEVRIKLTNFKESPRSLFLNRFFWTWNMLKNKLKKFFEHFFFLFDNLCAPTANSFKSFLYCFLMQKY